MTTIEDGMPVTMLLVAPSDMRLSGVTRQPLPEGERRILGLALTALDPFAELSPTLTLGVLRTFLTITQDEGMTISDYAERMRISKSLMSRYVLDLSVKRRAGKEGFGLLEIKPNPQEMRQHLVYLTPTGRALARKIARVLNLK